MPGSFRKPRPRLPRPDPIFAPQPQQFAERCSKKRPILSSFVSFTAVRTCLAGNPKAAWPCAECHRPSPHQIFFDFPETNWEDSALFHGGFVSPAPNDFTAIGGRHGGSLRSFE